MHWDNDNFHCMLLLPDVTVGPSRLTTRHAGAFVISYDVMSWSIKPIMNIFFGLPMARQFCRETKQLIRNVEFWNVDRFLNHTPVVRCRWERAIEHTSEEAGTLLKERGRGKVWRSNPLLGFERGEFGRIGHSWDLTKVLVAVNQSRCPPHRHLRRCGNAVGGWQD